MGSLTRRILVRDLKILLKNQKKFYASAPLSSKDDFFVKCSYGDVVIPNVRFIDHLWRDAKSFQNLVALKCALTKKMYTYSQLFKTSAVFATSLRKKLGLKEKDVVFTMLPNIPDYVAVCLGTLQAGCVLSTTNPLYKEHEISHQVTITKPKVFITIPECYDVASKALQNAKIDAKMVVIAKAEKVISSNAIRFSEIAENGEADYKLLDAIDVKLEDVALIPFSSGTTGLPKGVEITNRNLVAALEIMSAEESCFPILGDSKAQDVLPCILPIFHIYGFVVNLMGHISKGCKLITIPKFSSEIFFDVLSKEKINLLYLVPPIAILLGKHPAVKEEFFRDVRHIICGAAPLAATDIEAVLQKSKKDIQFHQGYGATETTSLATTVPKDLSGVDYNASGFLMRNFEFKFLDTVTGKPVPIGQPGELLIRSPTVMKGYHKNEEATRESFADDGFFKTGDLGYYKPDKGLYITERIKELIKVKGAQVAPAELESVLRTHPAVAEAAVIGVPHQFYGEVPKAFVILKANSKASVKDLINFVSSQVADYKRVEELMFVKDIPKTASGKILRKDLKKMYT